MLTGFRERDRSLLAGHWLPGELLGLPVADRPPLADAVTVEPPSAGSALVVLPGAGFVRLTELDWVHRRARLEIGLQAAPEDPVLLLKTALAYGFRALNLHRLYGWVTPAVHPDLAALTAAGLEREAVVPQALWHDGRPVDRELWGVLDG